MEKDRQITDFIKGTAGKYLPDAQILLFGSQARKDTSFHSDYDILIITAFELTPKQKLPIKTNIRKDLLLHGIRSDILIQSKEEVRIKRKLPGHIIKTIINEAISL